MSTTYNLLEPQDAQLVSYEVEEEGNVRCQILSIIGRTTSGYDMVITKIDTCFVALLADTQRAKEVCYDDHAPARMTAEEILTRIGFLVPVKEEAMP